MRTSLVKIQQIEQHIFHGAPLQSAAPQDVQNQLMVYSVVEEYGRKQLKKELEAIYTQLFTSTRFSRFRRRIMRLFR